MAGATVQVQLPCERTWNDEKPVHCAVPEKPVTYELPAGGSKSQAACRACAQLLHSSTRRAGSTLLPTHSRVAAAANTGNRRTALLLTSAHLGSRRRQVVEVAPEKLPTPSRPSR